MLPTVHLCPSCLLLSIGTKTADMYEQEIWCCRYPKKYAVLDVDSLARVV